MTSTNSTSRRRGGRPKSEDPRADQICIRLTQSEKSDLESRAGAGNLGDFIRAQIFGRKVRNPDTVPAINREAWIELAPLAANLNQIAHHLNAGKSVAPDHIQDIIEQTCELLTEVRVGLLTGK
ncbi:MAG: MobC family plasmid mobilization relaxosome protein [Shimia sp.]|mgnify:FL=1|uniref:plasmid mobilization protein n=1 Tax=Shimia sp. TaxID=1954381 RepID=UPI0025DECEF1|nr:plasmid mobilization relaxosome protein MobC [Shimia sp.]MCH2065910.1 MobC family plasmid mobilization relaxosome protein [Shimia sp.]